MFKQCCRFIAIVVIPILVAYAYYILTPEPVSVDWEKETPYNCGEVSYADLWTRGLEAVQKLNENGYSSSQHFLTGIKPKAFNPDAEYAYYDLTSLLPRWFLRKFPPKLRLSIGYLEENSAYVSVYCMPPPMKFSSFAVYNLVRWRSGKIEMLGAELSRPINRYSVNRTDDGLVVMITSADYGTFDRIRDTFIQAGIPESAFNFYAINPKLINFHDPSLAPLAFFRSRPDVLNFVFRRSIPEDLDEMDRYRPVKFPTWYLSPPASQPKNPVNLEIMHRPFGDQIYRAGGNGLEPFKDSAADLHLESGLDIFEKAVIDWVESTTGMKYKDRDVIEPVEHKAYQCILDKTYLMMPPQEIYDLYGDLARCARITDDCAVAHTRPTPDLRARGFAYKDGKLFVLIASNRKPLNVVYSSQMITQADPAVFNPHINYENKENLVSWRDTALADSSKIIGEGFEDFTVAFSGAQCPESLKSIGSACKSPNVTYSDGGLVVVERLYLNKDTLYGPRWNKILPSRVLQFE